MRGSRASEHEFLEPVASSEDEQSGHSDTVETVGFTAGSGGPYRFVVRRASGAAVSRLQLLVLTLSDAALRHRTVSGSLPSPVDSRNTGSVAIGAVRFTQTDRVEPFSSQGPTLDGRTKPDLVAVDCTTTATYRPFCGTRRVRP